MNQREPMTIETLSRLAGVPVRTIRYYIAQGLLPGARARGKGAGYAEEHLLRLRLIRLLVEQRVPLATIQERLAPLTIEEVRHLLARQEETRHHERVSERASPREYVSALLERARQSREPLAELSAPPSPPAVPPQPARTDVAPLPAPGPAPAPPAATGVTWRRIDLGPGVELHVRSDAETTQQSLIRRILSAARPTPGAEDEDRTSSRAEGSRT